MKETEYLKKNYINFIANFRESNGIDSNYEKKDLWKVLSVVR